MHIYNCFLFYFYVIVLAKLLQAEEKCFHLQNEKEEVEEEKEKLLKEQQELSITIQQLKESLSEMQLLLENKEKELNGENVMQ